MADPQITVELVGWRNRRGRFQSVSGRARDRSRAATRKQLKDLAKTAADMSPVGKHPFGKPAGKRFKQAWTVGYRDTDTGGEGELTNEAAHAGYVIFPTRPHPIVAKHAKVLRFQGSSGVVFRRAVKHPGTKGNDIPARLVTEFGRGIERELQTVAAQVAVDLAEVFQD